jgi:hypothetical protein
MSTIRVIGLPCGRPVSLGEYVRSWRVLKTLPAARLVERWSHFATPAGEILEAIAAGVQDRINRHIPGFGQGRRWSEDWFRSVLLTARTVNGTRVVLDWVPEGLETHLAHRLRDPEME